MFWMEANRFDRLRAVFLWGRKTNMLDGIDRIIVENIKTKEVLAEITENEITTASEEIVVRMRPVYD